MEHAAHLSAVLKKHSAEIGVYLHDDQLAQFMIYLKQLQAWNRSLNLTSITQDTEIIIKHFVDSLAGLQGEEFKCGASLLDVGTGAGFPGIPLRIARQDLQVTLVEPSPKKVSFLYYIVGLLHLDRVKIFSGTLEQFMRANTPSQLFDYITSRALNHQSILRSGRKLLSQEGKAIVYSSRPMNMLELGNDWSLATEHPFDLPNGLGRRVISILSASPERVA